MPLNVDPNKGVNVDSLVRILERIKANFALKSHTHSTSDINSGNVVTGVKGNSESSYRTGQVNITAANIGAATSSHTHGNIQNGGTLQANDVIIGAGDKLVITDSDGSNKIARASLTFDGSTDNEALTRKGTWETISDENVKVKNRGTTKAYLLSTSTAPTNSDQKVTALAESGVYLDTTAGKLVATSFSGNGSALTNLNPNNLSSTVPTSKLPTASSNSPGMMTAAQYSKLDAFSSASNYALKSDIVSLYRHMGSVATVNDLLSIDDPTIGDVYNVTDTGMNYVYVGEPEYEEMPEEEPSGLEAWDALGSMFSQLWMNNNDIDSIFNNAGLDASIV